MLCPTLDPTASPPTADTEEETESNEHRAEAAALRLEKASADDPSLAGEEDPPSLLLLLPLLTTRGLFSFVSDPAVVTCRVRAPESEFRSVAATVFSLVWKRNVGRLRLDAGRDETATAAAVGVGVDTSIVLTAAETGRSVNAVAQRLPAAISVC